MAKRIRNPKEVTPRKKTLALQHALTTVAEIRSHITRAVDGAPDPQFFSEVEELFAHLQKMEGLTSAQRALVENACSYFHQVSLLADFEGLLDRLWGKIDAAAAALSAGTKAGPSERWKAIEEVSTLKRLTDSAKRAIDADQSLPREIFLQYISADAITLDDLRHSKDLTEAQKEQIRKVLDIYSEKLETPSRDSAELYTALEEFERELTALEKAVA